MVVIVFRSRIRDAIDMERLEAMGVRMYETASAMPGFVSYKDFAAEDGEALTLVEFASHAELLAWRHHEEHVAIQQEGRDWVFESYDIAICDVSRRYGFHVDRGRFSIAGEHA